MKRTSPIRVIHARRRLLAVNQGLSGRRQLSLVLSKP